jgi:hypothetical protein
MSAVSKPHVRSIRSMMMHRKGGPPPARHKPNVGMFGVSAKSLDLPVTGRCTVAVENEGEAGESW